MSRHFQNTFATRPFWALFDNTAVEEKLGNCDVAWAKKPARPV